MLAILGTTVRVQANSTALIYETGSQRKKLLYEYQLEEAAGAGSEAGTEVLKGSFQDLDGQTVFLETAHVKGLEIQRDEVEQRQINEKAQVEVKDDKIYFSKTSQGKTSVKVEKLKAPFVMASNFRRFVSSRWEDVQAGTKISIRFGVWARQETVGFDIIKIGEEKMGDQKAVLVQMKASSFFIAALVDPILFKFSSDGTKILEMIGRVAVKQKVGKDFKDMDADVVYSYP